MREEDEKFPEPLPPLERNVVLIARHPMRIRCCAKKCHQNEGTLTCSSCFAVRYCSMKCSRDHWSQHKALCREVKDRRGELVRLARPLRNCQPPWSDRMIDMFQSDGRFDQQAVNGEDINTEESRAYREANEEYQVAFQKCGEESRSELAFRLQAANCLNMMRLSYKGRISEGIRTMILGAMIAGHMDQEALNYIRYHLEYKISLDCMSHHCLFSQVLCSETDKSSGPSISTC